MSYPQAGQPHAYPPLLPHEPPQAAGTSADVYSLPDHPSGPPPATGAWRASSPPGRAPGSEFGVGSTVTDDSWFSARAPSSSGFPAGLGHPAAHAAWVRGDASDAAEAVEAAQGRGSPAGEARLSYPTYSGPDCGDSDAGTMGRPTVEKARSKEGSGRGVLGGDAPPAPAPVQRQFSRTQMAFLTTFLVQTVVVLVCIVVVYLKVQDETIVSNSRLRTVTVYLSVFTVANVFAILMAVDALRNKNTIQLIGIVMFNLMMMVYGAILPAQLREAVTQPSDSINMAASGNDCNPYVTCYGLRYLYGNIEGWIITIPVITGVCSIISACLTWLLYKEFGWAIFKQIGADITLKRIYSYWQVFTLLLKFDFFFFIGFSIQFLILVSGVSDTEEDLTIAAAPVSIAVIILAAVGVRKEIHSLMVVFTVCWVGALVYFIYKLIKTYQDSNNAFSVAQRSLSLFSILSILTLMATGVLAGMCWRNFGRGLKQQRVHTTLDLFRSTKQRQRPDGPTRRPSRMSLD